MEFDLEKFSSRLQELMEQKNLTVYSLAEAVYLSPGTISKYLNSKLEPRRSTIESLARYLNVNPVWLMGLDVEKKLKSETTKRIPILGQIAAGIPIHAEENIEGYEIISESLNVDFCLRVKGDSMINARILDGDIVYLQQKPDVENGEIAAVLIDNDSATLKRVYKVNGSVILRAENPNYPDKVFSKKDMVDVKIIGKAIFFKSEVR